MVSALGSLAAGLDALAEETIVGAAASGPAVTLATGSTRRALSAFTRPFQGNLVLNTRRTVRIDADPVLCLGSRRRPCKQCEQTEPQAPHGERV